MYEYLIHPITLLCLATIFILVALLFFYFKRSLSFLERAQMEQARVLQSFIANMEMNNMRQQQQMVGGTPSPIHQNPIPDSELIDVSDDEDSDDETDSDESDSDDENDDDTSQQITPSSQVIELSDEVDSDNIKVIQINSNESGNIPLVIDELVMDKNNESSSSEEEEDDSDDEDDEDDEDETMNVVEPTNLVTNTNHEEPVDYKSLTVVSLREIAESKGLIQKGDKTTKKDLLKLLE